MPNLPEALDDALRDYYRPGKDFRSLVSTKRGREARMRAMEREYGTKKAAAAAAGVSPDTWSKWGKGRKPTAASQKKLQTAHTTLLRAARVKAKGLVQTFTIHAVVVAGQGKRRYINKLNSGDYHFNGPDSGGYRPFRTLDLGLSARQDIINAWKTGQSPSEVATELIDAINRAYPDAGGFSFEGHQVIVILDEPGYSARAAA